MNSKETGGPAFPHPQGWRRDPCISVGMTLRDYLAAKAMAALARENYTESEIAVWACKMADAMLAERLKE